MREFIKILGAFFVASALITLPGALAVSSNYYAQSLVIFNVPSDATFSVAMPSNYGSWTAISSTSDYPSGTATDWISFNFTSGSQSALQEPYEAGASGTKQTGTTSPIYWIKATGNTNISLDIKLNMTEPTGIQLNYNASCNGPGGNGCGTVKTAITRMTTAYQSLCTQLNFTAGTFLNVTLYANTSGVSGGNSLVYIAMRSTATS